MVRLKYKNTFIYLTNAEHISLLARFNILNFKPQHYVSGWLINETPCVLCKKYRKYDGDIQICRECPFDGIFEKDNYAVFGCITVMKGILKKLVCGFSPFDISVESISFREFEKDKCTKILELLTNFLKSGVKIPFWRKIPFRIDQKPQKGR